MPRNAATNALLGLPTFSSWVKQYWSSMYTCSKHNFKALSLVKFSYTSVIWLRYKYVGWLGYNISSQCLKMTQNVSFECSILAFSTNFCPFKTDLSGNTVWPQASVFKNLSNFWHFYELLSTQNVNVARFARIVECDFLGRFLNTMKVHLDKQSKVICNWPSSLWQSR